MQGDGRQITREIPHPYQVLKNFDLIFAKGRCALEAIAVGAAVVLCGAHGLGPLVTTPEFDRLRRQNFGIRSLRRPLKRDALLEEIDRYDPGDAQAVCGRVRAEAGKDAVIQQIVDLYHRAIEEHKRVGADPALERSQTVAYLRTAAAVFHGGAAQEETKALREELADLRSKLTATRAERDRVLRDLGRLPGYHLLRSGRRIKGWLARRRTRARVH